MIHQRPRLRLRSVFISDIHLGSPACQAAYLLDFLQSIECETLYLVGDVIDLLAMRRRVHWPDSHAAVVQTILDKAAAGTRVVYIPGNHDAALRALAGSQWLGVEVRLNASHYLADGRRFLIAHGDEFDASLKVNRLLHAVGDLGHQLLLFANRHVNFLRRRLGFHYWPVAAAIKARLSGANRYARAFELAAVRTVRRRGYHGFIGGHVHVARVSVRNRVTYCNDGDWVEHCTSLVEDWRGGLSLLHWSERPYVVHGPLKLETADLPELRPAAEGA